MRIFEDAIKISEGCWKDNFQDLQYKLKFPVIFRNFQSSLGVKVGEISKPKVKKENIGDRFLTGKRSPTQEAILQIFRKISLKQKREHFIEIVARK